jgi:hypothetical protein
MKISAFQNILNQVDDLKPDVIQLGFLKLRKGFFTADQSQEYGYKFEPKTALSGVRKSLYFLPGTDEAFTNRGSDQPLLEYGYGK